MITLLIWVYNNYYLLAMNIARRKSLSIRMVNCWFFSNIIRPRRSRRDVAAYSHQTFRGRSVGRSVGLSSASWKNGGSDPDAVWHRRSDRSRDEAGGGVWRSVHGRGYFWRQIWGAPLSIGTYRAYACYSAATRPSCQITLDRLVPYSRKFFIHCTTRRLAS